MELITPEDFEVDIKNNHSLVRDNLFAYKSPYKIGEVYVNKDSFVKLGAIYMSTLMTSIVHKAIENGFTLGDEIKKIAIVGPSYGAINYAPKIAETLEYCFNVTAMALRTELDRDDDKKHIIPTKLMPYFEEADIYIIIEDIVNNFETGEQIVNLLKSKVSKDKPTFLFSAFNRGINNHEKAANLGLSGFYPFLERELPEYDIRIPEGLAFLNESLKNGMTFHPNLGKTKDFLKDFGEGPYTKEQIAKIKLEV